MAARLRLLLFLVALAVVTVGCNTSVFELDVGHCFNDPESFDEVADVETVSCSEAHDNEVFAIEEVAGGSNWPGQDLVSEAADNACVTAFESYVGVDYFSSVYELGWLSPTETSWADGDREVICFLYDPALDPIVGSARGSGI